MITLQHQRGRLPCKSIYRYGYASVTEEKNCEDASVVNNRFSKANFPDLEEYEEMKKESPVYLVYVDANNLYGWAMSLPLPTINFMWVENVDEFDVVSTDSWRR